MFRSNLYLGKRHQGKINFLKKEREELLHIVNSGPYSTDMDYIYEAIFHISEEIARLEDEKYL